MKSLLILPLFCLLFIGCKEAPEQTIIQDPNWTKEESINMHTTFAAEEDEEIESFLSRRPDWRMTKTGTGLRYFIYEKSENNDTARVGDEVLINFNISLLNGDICYTSEKNGAESFIVEKADIESGLHEAFQLMCSGDKAKFILPSHMAHGMIGDEDKIPPLTPVIYDIDLIEIAKPN
jgi:gliding motility-associated peptidyl-prolyl isomerase